MRVPRARTGTSDVWLSRPVSVDCRLRFLAGMLLTVSHVKPWHLFVLETLLAYALRYNLRNMVIYNYRQYGSSSESEIWSLVIDVRVGMSENDVVKRRKCTCHVIRISQMAILG